MSSPALCEKDPEKAKAINEVQHQVFLFLQMCVFVWSTLDSDNDLSE